MEQVLRGQLAASAGHWGTREAGQISSSRPESADQVRSLIFKLFRCSPGGVSRRLEMQKYAAIGLTDEKAKELARDPQFAGTLDLAPSAPDGFFVLQISWPS
jgi:hypothetical protein